MNVKIISDGTSYGTKVQTADGAPVGGVTEILFRAQINDVNRAELHLACSGIEAEAEAAVYVAGREVRRIEYADGTITEFPAD